MKNSHHGRTLKSNLATYRLASSSGVIEGEEKVNKDPYQLIENSRRNTSDDVDARHLLTEQAIYLGWAVEILQVKNSRFKLNTFYLAEKLDFLMVGK